MYRQWRECTKAVISGKKPRYKKHAKITEEYLLYARKRLQADPKLGKLYNQNHGIIALRDDFLNDRGTTGAEVIRKEIEAGDHRDVSMNVILIPIATLGCGKTTLGVALNRLFGWQQFQNDNIVGQGNRGPRFVQEVASRLARAPVVFADRNNHQKRERSQFIEDVTKIVPDATLVALHYVHSPNKIETIRQSLRDRVFARGDNHQTIRARFNDPPKIRGIMDGFIGRFQPLDTESYPDCDFDFVIDLDPLAESRDNLDTVISKLLEQYPKIFRHPDDMPTGADLDEAIHWARNDYKPESTNYSLDYNNFNNNGQVAGGAALARKQKHPDPTLSGQPSSKRSSSGKVKKPAKTEYFAVTVPADRIMAILTTLFANMPPARAFLFRQMQQMNRIQKEFHVTLMHRVHAGSHAAKWAEYEAAHKAATEKVADSAAGEASEGNNSTTIAADPGVMGKCGVQLERVVWDRRIMAFVVRLVPVEGEGNREWESVNRVAHITVGTAGPEVKPKESNDLLAKWLDGEAVEGLDDEKVTGHVVLEGVVKAVMQRH
jgi:tRNA ligase